MHFPVLSMLGHTIDNEERRDWKRSVNANINLTVDARHASNKPLNHLLVKSSASLTQYVLLRI